jgi:FkbM family methyltransferase
VKKIITNFESKNNNYSYLTLLEFFACNKVQSKSQISQDLLVLYFHQLKKNGFFVEVGAADGFHLSNTLFLELYGWKGIIAEPLPAWHEKIMERKCYIDKRCVYENSGSKVILKYILDHPLESRVTEDLDLRSNFSSRKKSIKLEVDTISLNDLLELYQAPNKIEYISIDTEGSEYKILKKFNFKKYDVEIFTIEHNYIESIRNNIFELMLDNNYVRVFQKISQWDDWYIKKNNKILEHFI